MSTRVRGRRRYVTRKLSERERDMLRKSRGAFRVLHGVGLI